jgi:cell wall-associated NlpC family hydrolase
VTGPSPGLPNSLDAVVARALSQVGRPIRYGMGHGGMHAGDESPTRDGLCDCSGFAMWCVGRPRFDGAAWWDTTRIMHDAQHARSRFASRDWQAAQPGDLVVYGDTRDATGRNRHGHVGVVTAVDSSGPISVVHCSKGNDTIFGVAVRETGPEKFRTRGIVARPRWEAA